MSRTLTVRAEATTPRSSLTSKHVNQGSAKRGVARTQCLVQVTPIPDT